VARLQQGEQPRGDERVPGGEEADEADGEDVVGVEAVDGGGGGQGAVDDPLEVDGGEEDGESDGEAEVGRGGADAEGREGHEGVEEHEEESVEEVEARVAAHVDDGREAGRDHAFSGRDQEQSLLMGLAGGRREGHSGHEFHLLEEAPFGGFFTFRLDF